MRSKDDVHVLEKNHTQSVVTATNTCCNLDEAESHILQENGNIRAGADTQQGRCTAVFDQETYTKGEKFATCGITMAGPEPKLVGLRKQYTYEFKLVTDSVVLFVKSEGMRILG